MRQLAFIFAVLLSFTCGSSEVVTRTTRWTNFKDFLTQGWTQEYNTTRQWKNPVDMDPLLLNLNGNFTDRVWGFLPESGSGSYQNYFYLNITALPEFCGIINATLNIKMYHSVEVTYSTVYPVKGYPSNTRPIDPMNGTIRWITISNELDLDVSKAVELYFDIYEHELVVFDEFSITYTADQNDHNCPYACNHDCEYRGIDCQYYYTCVDKKFKEIHSCNLEKGLAFNPVIKTCDFIENVVGCETKPEECICAYKPHPTNCSSYYYCNNTCIPEECEERHCPTGLVWSADALGDGSEHQQCILPENATCAPETTTPMPIPIV